MLYFHYLPLKRFLKIIPNKFMLIYNVFFLMVLYNKIRNYYQNLKQWLLIRIYLSFKILILNKFQVHYFN